MASKKDITNSLISPTIDSKIEPGSVFLNTDGHRLFFTKPDRSVSVKAYHSPFCLVMCDDNYTQGGYASSVDSVIRRIEDRVQQELGDGEYDEEGNNYYNPYESPYKYILTDDNGKLKHTNPRIYRSFHNPSIRYRTFELHTTKSYKVPDVSTALFTDFGLATAEFDIPYRERVLTDLQGDDRLWHLDTDNEVCELRVLAYDIEVTQSPDEADAAAVSAAAARKSNRFGKDGGGGSGNGDDDDDDDEKNNEGPSVDGSLPVDVIGYAEFVIKYRARRVPETGKCEFEFMEMPDWTEPEIVQLVGKTIDEEVKNHVKFIDVMERNHIICGHNIMAYDNIQEVNRLRVLLNMGKFKGEDKVKVENFINTWTRTTNIFSYGDMKEVVDIYPLSFDTYFASKRLYFFLDKYDLKSLAQNFGYVIPDRVYLDAINIKMDTPEQEKKTLKYNEHDVREQLGLTMQLLPDAMRLCHMSGMTFNDCMPAGTTKIWDAMTHIQSHRNRRVMPATVQAMAVCEELFHKLGTRNKKTKKPYTKKEIFDIVRKAHNSTSPFTPKPLKLAKYGLEMPDYMQYPQLIYNPYNKERLHAIASPKCPCSECQKIPFEIRNCDCDFCLKVRARWPDGLGINDRDEQVEFIVEELKAMGHTEPEDVLTHFADAARGYRNKKEGYHFPGGMALHPDWPEVNAHFKMWWGVQVCDVGSMYPSNLSAEDIGGDTSRFAHPDFYTLDGCNIRPRNNSFHKSATEEYYWVYLKRIRKDVLDNFMIYIPAYELVNNDTYKSLADEYPFVQDGYLVAVVVDTARGGAPFAMNAVLDITADIKRIKGELEKPDSGATSRQLRQIAGAYQSMKGLRNSGSVDASRCVKVITPNGELINKNISEFYEMFEVEPVFKELNGITFEVKNIESFGWKGLAVDENRDVVVVPVVNVIRHIYDGEMVNVYGAFKDKVHMLGCFTPNHSLVSFAEGRKGLIDSLPEIMEIGILACKVKFHSNFLPIKSKYDDLSLPYNHIAIPFSISHTVRVNPTSIFVYDLEMKGVHNFIDGSGLVAKNTHGILTAPTVSNRQFCLSGGARITTLGQCVLDDAMKKFGSIQAKTTYGDTDGIYAATSKDARTIPAIKKILDINDRKKGQYITEPEIIEQAVKAINKKWQDKLHYPTYELEVEWHDGMLFVKHKNYLIFDHVVDKETGEKRLKMKMKGNNFKAKDKPKFTVDILESIMFEVARKHAIWEDEDKEFLSVRTDIKEKAREVITNMDFTDMPIRKLQVRQGIAPMCHYKQQTKPCPVCGGAPDQAKACAVCAGTGCKLSVYAARTNGIESLLRQRLKTRVAMMCVVCNNPLPNIHEPRKSASKPLAYLWPVDLLDNDYYKELSGGIDYEWYQYSAFNYVKGAFGFENWNIDPWVCTAKQMTLDGDYMVKIIPGAKYADKNVFARGGKTLSCSQEVFDRLRTKENVPDDIVELLFADTDMANSVMGIDPDAPRHNPWEEYEDE